jgi:hypothetical protein
VFVRSLDLLETEVGATVAAAAWLGLTRHCRPDGNHTKWRGAPISRHCRKLASNAPWVKPLTLFLDVVVVNNKGRYCKMSAGSLIFVNSVSS